MLTDHELELLVEAIGKALGVDVGGMTDNLWVDAIAAGREALLERARQSGRTR